MKVCSETRGAPGRLDDPRKVLKLAPARLPLHDVRQGPGGNGKRREISRNIERLNPVLRRLFLFAGSPHRLISTSSSRKMLISTPVIKGVETQHGGRFKVGNIPHHPNVGSVA